MRFHLLALWGLAALSAAGSVTEKFYEHLTPAERQAAGIASLTVEQQAALSVLADRWAEAKAEPAIIAARQKAAAEVRASIAAEKKASAGFARADTTPFQAIRTRIVGPFKEWGPGTRFTLENGQVWVAERGAESRFFGPLDQPEVEVRPGGFGTWKLELLSRGLWVRVTRVQ